MLMYSCYKGYLSTLAISLEEDRLALKQKDNVVRIRAFCLLG